MKRLPSGGYLQGAEGNSAQGFWLSTTEVTHAQYANFVVADHQWRQIEAFFDQKFALAEDGQVLKGAPPWVPHTNRQELSTAETWPQLEIDFEAERVSRYRMRRRFAQWPVSGVTRSDALSFCAWLSKEAGVTVRLPTLDEWRQATGVADPLRIYPWGDLFDAAFVAGHRTGNQTPYPVASVDADRGPYGHRDLGGSMREWVRGGEEHLVGGYDAVVVGGGWTDSLDSQFRSLAVEAVPSTTTHEQIGFRLVVVGP